MLCQKQTQAPQQPTILALFMHAPAEWPGVDSESPTPPPLPHAYRPPWKDVPPCDAWSPYLRHALYSLPHGPLHLLEICTTRPPCKMLRACSVPPSSSTPPPNVTWPPSKHHKVPLEAWPASSMPLHLTAACAQHPHCKLYLRWQARGPTSSKSHRRSMLLDFGMPILTARGVYGPMHSTQYMLRMQSTHNASDCYRQTQHCCNQRPSLAQGLHAPLTRARHHAPFPSACLPAPYVHMLSTP